jgi:hypothetical protein
MATLVLLPSSLRKGMQQQQPTKTTGTGWFILPGEGMLGSDGMPLW